MSFVVANMSHCHTITFSQSYTDFLVPYYTRVGDSMYVICVLYLPNSNNREVSSCKELVVSVRHVGASRSSLWFIR